MPFNNTEQFKKTQHFQSQFILIGNYFTLWDKSKPMINNNGNGIYISIVIVLLTLLIVIMMIITEIIDSNGNRNYNSNNNIKRYFTAIKNVIRYTSL